MPRTPVSLTLDEENLRWLRGRARIAASGNLSEAVNQLVTQARTGSLGAAVPARSVVGTIDIAPADPALLGADEAVQATFTSSLTRPMMARERPADRPLSRPSKGRRTRTRGRRG